MRTGTRLQQIATPGVSTEAAVQAAYAAHGGELYRFALRSLHDDGTAQDVVQETFLRAWRSADRYDSRVATLRVWLFAIARNVIVDMTRRRAAGSWALVPGDADAVERVLQPEPDRSDAVVTTWLVEEALRRLSEEHRQVITETHLRGRSYDEVAAEWGVPAGTLRSRTFYALKALRVAMDEMGVTL